MRTEEAINIPFSFSWRMWLMGLSSGDVPLSVLKRVRSGVPSANLSGKAARVAKGEKAVVRVERDCS